MNKSTRLSLFAVVASAMILVVCASPHDPIGDAIQIRALLDSTSAPNVATTVAAATTAQASTTSAAAATSPATTSSAAAATTAAASSSSSQAAAATTTHPNSAGAPTTQVAVSTVATTTDAAGQVITTVITDTPSQSSQAPPPTNSSNNNSESGGLSTGSIIGLSVAGGIAALGIVLFFVWKFTRKRFSDFDDNEAIKWPELNAHNTDVHALPTNATGRAGFGPENDSDLNLTRAPSPGGAYANSIAASSVPEVYGAADPYAVPPLPHLNPNQPYRDEPGAFGQPAGYYDPYRGPVPNTFTDPAADGHGAESIPMTQLARSRSPGPQMAYDMQGRGSPVPQAAMGYAGMDERSRTPIPAALAQGRASPAPQPGYGYGS